MSAPAGSVSLGKLLRTPGIRRARESQRRPAGRRHELATGCARLDAVLPGGGWPQGALTEILCDHQGTGEVGLLAAALADLSRRGRWIAWVAPPHLPYAPALAARGFDLCRVLVVRTQGPSERLWAAEQALRSGCCGAVLLWPGTIGPRFSARGRWLRRLHLAAEAGRAWGVVFRPASAVAEASPAVLRLAVAPTGDGLEVRIHKCRGAPSGGRVVLPIAGQRPVQ